MNEPDKLRQLSHVCVPIYVIRENRRYRTPIAYSILAIAVTKYLLFIHSFIKLKKGKI